MADASPKKRSSAFEPRSSKRSSIFEPLSPKAIRGSISRAFSGSSYPNLGQDGGTPKRDGNLKEHICLSAEAIKKEEARAKIDASLFSRETTAVGGVLYDHGKSLEVIGQIEAKPQKDLVHTNSYNYAMATLMILHVALITVQTEFQGPASDIAVIVGGLFTYLFLLDFALRFTTGGTKTMKDKVTMFDVGLVVLPFLEGQWGGTAVFRGLPAARIFVYTMRLGPRIRFFRESVTLQVVLETIWGAKVTIMWSVFLFLGLCWAFAMVSAKVIGESGEWNDVSNPLEAWPPFVSFDRRTYFGSVGRSMLTLVQIATLDAGTPVMRPVAKVYQVTPVLFFVFVLLTSFGLLSSIVGCFVEAARQSRRRCERQLTDAAIEKKIRMGNIIEKIMHIVDLNHDGEITLEELHVAFEQGVEFHKLLDEIEVPMVLRSGENFVAAFDVDNSLSISREELIDGLLCMDEEISPKDIVKLEKRMRFLVGRAHLLEERFEVLTQRVRQTCAFLRIIFENFDEWARGDRRANALIDHRAREYLKRAPPQYAPVVKEYQDLLDRQREETEDAPANGGEAFMQKVQTCMLSLRKPRSEEAAAESVPRRPARKIGTEPPAPPAVPSKLPGMEGEGPEPPAPREERPAPPAVPPLPGSLPGGGDVERCFRGMPRPPLKPHPGEPNLFSAWSLRSEQMYGDKHARDQQPAKTAETWIPTSHPKELVP
eukprot:TRINITY_DN14038_c0_g1_i3.p1 TRINITY_DN14038_c0_g1~~TRINITY_DN14038_c0_g1_i3.p1  ORF type:complete len:711 (+),score=154.79 TRINITY_DN14038_c0_g1_i3:176-2308(+)